MPQYTLPPISNEREFEELLCDVMNHLYQTNSFSLYGVRGQCQNGIDVISFKEKTAVQCAWRDLNNSERHRAKKLVQKFLIDFQEAQKSQIEIYLFIVASTFKNDKRIQDWCALISLNHKCNVEYWSWDKITNVILSAPTLLKKYYPQFFNSGLSIGRITMDKSCNYIPMKKEHCFEFKSNAKKSDYPIIDISFLNNSDDVVLLNKIGVTARFMNMAHAGSYEKPVGLLDIHAKFDIKPQIVFDFNGRWRTVKLTLDSPLYIAPKHPARIQVRLTRELIGFIKLYLSFEFNSTILTTPIFFFNSDHDGAADIPRKLIKAIAERRKQQNTKDS